ncbi:glycoside hydrolase family 32 protein [Chitinophaga sancti]|uniref:glycoside hydrolase family 32 protein n=1 Tax=Chitinophaga sancti TaxID=1004 RepID=UPI003F79AE4C
MQRYLILLLALCFPAVMAAQKYRPVYHFSPKHGWIGDPDGLIKFRGKYHLFWWGHAVSNDLVHWQELPYPMQGGDGTFTYFSGSVVVDKRNTAGFGDSAMVAVYTLHKNDSVPEAQALSYSNDDTLFHFYKHNPVLDIGSNSFRDPQVFWYAKDQRWIMVVTHPHLHKVSFYASPDLKHWEHLSDFGPMGAVASDWEVPDLFALDGKWVLTIGQGPNRMQYFTGHFDGRSFVSDPQPEALWADYGPDFYAARSWRNADDTASTRVTWMGWLGNWTYARDVPSRWGKGFESIPRDLSLQPFPEGLRLVQQPVPELKVLRRDSIVLPRRKVNGQMPLTLFGSNSYELEVDIDLQTAKGAGLQILLGQGRSFVVGYDVQQKQLYIDRSNCSDTAFSAHFPVRMSAPLHTRQLQLHIFVDAASVEVFAQQGKIVLSATTFPSETQTGVALFAKGGTATVTHFIAWKLEK